MPLLEVSDVHAHYGSIAALRGVSLTVEEGEVVTIIGSNGAGKSTTLRSITGLTPASSGQIVFAGEDITRMAAHEIPSKGSPWPRRAPLLSAHDGQGEPGPGRLPAARAGGGPRI